MIQQKTPLYDVLYNHIEKGPISMHVPGHKNGRVFSDKGLEYFAQILKIDATELSRLDDLHDPEGAIWEAQELTAKLYGVKNSFFLVGGSTVGNLSMILGVCSSQDTVLVQRNSHKSIINGLKLAGVDPVFLQPEFDKDVQVASYVPFETVRLAIERFPKTKAIILTSPNYYGMINQDELSTIITFAHSKNIPVLIDEAHGAHFILEGFPSSAISLGADVVVHSAHKTLPAMTMGSYLHINSNLVNVHQIQSYLQILQSSSPSYPIMASLDLARYYLAKVRENGTNYIINEIKKFKEKLQQIPQIKVVESTNLGVLTDYLKVTIQSRCELNGYQLQALFETEGIYSELADPKNVLFVLPLAEDTDFERIYRKLKIILENYEPVNKEFINLINSSEKITSLGISYNAIKGYNKKVVSIDHALGNISGEMIVPYPPGIPILMEGERITERHLEIISTYLRVRARFQGGDIEGGKLTILDS